MKRFLPFTCITNTTKLITLLLGFALFSTNTATGENANPNRSINSDDGSIAVMCNNLDVIASGVDVRCNGLDNGSATATITGGVGPFTYLWSPGGETTQTIFDLAPGIYTVEVTDQNTLCTDTSNVTITEPDTLVLDLNVTSDILCFGDSTGAIDLTVTGGTPPYTYTWSNGENTEDISGLSSGTYSVIVIDANGCKKIGGITIPQPFFPLDLTITSQTNINCGQGTGAVTVNAFGGTPPYMYSINGGALQGSGTFSGLAAGTYTLLVQDANGCTSTEMVTITDTVTGPSITSTQVNVACFGGATGSIDITIAGGTAPYSYAWSNGAISEDISGLTAGGYSVTVTDSNGCASTMAFTISQPASGINLSITQVNISCFGAATGSIDLTTAGGTPPYTYAWSNGDTTEDISGLVAGNYDVTVTDANGCMASLLTPITITQPLTGLAITITATDESGPATNDGTATANVTGGTPAYSYLWSPGGETTQTITGLSDGVYTVTVTDMNGCTITESATILDGDCNDLAVTATGTSVTCNGLDNGTATATITGGDGPFTYLWSPGGATTQTITDLAAGTYTVTVTDQTTLCVETAMVTLTEPAAITTTLDVTNILCFGDNIGAIDLTVIGGTPPYTFTWSNGENTEDISGLFAGTYSVIIIDANGCKAIAGATITQPDFPLELEITSQTNIICGLGTGSVTVEATGGTAPYMYNIDGGALQASGTFTGLAAGAYMITATDANGCTETIAITITDTGVAPDIMATQVNVACFGNPTGSIDLTVSGGTAPYTFLWSPGGETTEDISGLTAGTYSVVVTGANGCSSTETFIITETDALVLTIDVIGQILCFGDTTVDLDLTIVGGTPPYSTTWSTGDSTEDIFGVGAGTYSVIVIDANGCKAIAGVTVTQPDFPLELNITSQTNIVCGQGTGSVTVEAFGGTAPYMYSIDGGAPQASGTFTGLAAGTYMITVIDANGCTETITITILDTGVAPDITATQVNVACFGGATGSIDLTVSGGTAPYTFLWSPGGEITEDISGLIAGTYSVTVTGANGCFITESFTITEPASALELSATQVDVLCFGSATGSIDLTVSGGTAPYTFLWSPGGETTEDITGLAAGTYTVTVTDANGCTATESYMITEPASALEITATQVNVACFGDASGSIDLTVSGGTAPYTFLWSPGGETTEDISGLAAGTYMVTVTDSNGCTATESFIITEPASALELSATQVNVACFGDASGSIDLTASGGTAPYTFLWSPGGETTEDITGLAVGTYTVTVTDANGCTATESFTITEPASALELTATQVNVACFGADDGSIDLTVTGGTAPYTFLWSPGGETTEDISGLAAGTYAVTVTDANGCTATASFIITEAASAIELTATQENVTCFGAATGSIDLTVTGGTPPYSFAWSNGATTEDIFGLAGGSYTVTVTDANGCTATETYIITTPASGMLIESTQVNIACFGTNTGSIDITVSGGDAPYTFVWSNGATTEDIAGLSDGTFTVTVTDANGCMLTESFTITAPSSAILIKSTQENISCFGDATGSIDLTVSGGDGPYTFVWSNGATTEDITGLTAGTYTVTVTDANGCDVTEEFIITQPDSAIEFEIVAQSDVVCDTGTGSITVEATGGTPPYMYSIDGGTAQNDGIFTDLASGSHDIVVTDANGCSETITVFINNSCIALIKTGTFNDEDGDGCSDVGETISYVFTVINTGNAPLTNITVTDAFATVVGGPLANLAGGASDATTFSATYTIIQDDIDAGEFANQAEVFGTAADGTVLTDLSDDNSELEDDMTITTLCQNASISLEKTGVFNDENGDFNTQVGETISYSFSVTNTGDVTLFNITLTDALPGIVIMGGPIASLLPGVTDSTTFTATYAVTQGDIDDMMVVNQAIVTATDSSGNQVMDTSDDPNELDDIDANGDGEPDDPTETILPVVFGAVFEIFNAVSPNEDGFNDYFRVEGINEFPDNSVKIYNRFGVLIYETVGYVDNESPGSNNFRGRSDGRATIQEGELLPTGTYFYVITFPKDNGDIDNPSNPGKTNYQGYLYINR